MDVRVTRESRALGPAFRNYSKRHGTKSRATTKELSILFQYNPAQRKNPDFSSLFYSTRVHGAKTRSPATHNIEIEEKSQGTQSFVTCVIILNMKKKKRAIKIIEKPRIHRRVLLPPRRWILSHVTPFTNRAPRAMAILARILTRAG